uniref:WD repeat domain 41 n=1 Tax=Oryctolagus cuniculus TaxID=9986 RepID=A0A5F9CN11_RABIT
NWESPPLHPEAPPSTQGTGPPPPVLHRELCAPHPPPDVHPEHCPPPLCTRSTAPSLPHPRSAPGALPPPALHPEHCRPHPRTRSTPPHPEQGRLGLRVADLCPDRQLISCSEDGSVRIWALREAQQAAAEPVPTGFFNMWGFGRVNKQASPPARKPEVATSCSLELIGDLIGHSSSVEMVLYFEEHGLVTCSADHLIVLWKKGARESERRSLQLFQKLEEQGGLHRAA